MKQLKSLQENRIYFLMIPHHMHIGSLFLKVCFLIGRFTSWKGFHTSLKNCSAMVFMLPLHWEHVLELFFEGGGDCERMIFVEYITSSPKENLCMNFNWEQASRSATWRLIEIHSETVPRKRIFQYLNYRTYWKTWRLTEIQSVMVYHWKSISPNPRSHSNIENIKQTRKCWCLAHPVFVCHPI